MVCKRRGPRASTALGKSPGGARASRRISEASSFPWGIRERASGLSVDLRRRRCRCPAAAAAAIRAAALLYLELGWAAASARPSGSSSGPTWPPRLPGYCRPRSPSLPHESKMERYYSSTSVTTLPVPNPKTYRNPQQMFLRSRKKSHFGEMVQHFEFVRLPRLIQLLGRFAVVPKVHKSCTLLNRFKASKPSSLN